MPILRAPEICSSDAAVADEKYFYHCGFSSFIALICRVLRRFARVGFCGKIVKNITVSAKRSKMRRIEAVKRSQNVVKGGAFYYSGYFKNTVIFLQNSIYYIIVLTMKFVLTILHFLCIMIV